MKRKNLNQKEYGYTHTKQRLKERYELEITRSEYDTLCEKIRERKNGILDRHSEYISHMKRMHPQKKGFQLILDTPFKNQIIKIVWEDHRDCITTVLKMLE